MSRLKRAFVLLLALVMAASLMVPAFADDSSASSGTQTSSSQPQSSSNLSSNSDPIVDPGNSSYPWVPDGVDPNPTPEPGEIVQKCLGYNIVSGSISRGSKATIELVVYDSGVYRHSYVDKQYTTLGSCDFTQRPEDSERSTVTVDPDSRNLIIRMEDVIYSGTGNQLAVDVGYRVRGDGYRNLTLTLTIREANSSEGGDWSSLAPKLLVSQYCVAESGAALPEEGLPEASKAVAGKPFDLMFELYNSSKSTRIQNMTVQVNGGETFTQTSGTDTLYIDSLGAGASTVQRIPFTTLASCKPGSSAVTLTVNFEYYDNGAKQSGSETLTLMVPVSQTDRIKPGNMSVDYGYTNNEVSLNYSFANIGFTTLYNAEVQVYDENDQLLASKYVGTVEPSKEVKGSDISLVFTEPGDHMLRVTLAYEDENTNAYTFDADCSAYVDEYVEPSWNDDPVVPEPEETSTFPMWIVWVGIGLLVAAGGTILVIKLVKKNREKQRKEMEDYDEDL